MISSIVNISPDSRRSPPGRPPPISGCPRGLPQAPGVDFTFEVINWINYVFFAGITLALGLPGDHTVRRKNVEFYPDRSTTPCSNSPGPSFRHSSSSASSSWDSPGLDLRTSPKNTYDIKVTAHRAWSSRSQRKVDSELSSSGKASTRSKDVSQSVHPRFRGTGRSSSDTPTCGPSTQTIPPTTDFTALLH